MDSYPRMMVDASVYGVTGRTYYPSGAHSLHNIISPSSSEEARYLQKGSASAKSGTTRPIDAFDMVTNPVLRQEAINNEVDISKTDNYLTWTKNQFLLNSLYNVAYIASSLPFVKFTLQQQITQHFDGGSTAVLQFDFATQTWYYVHGSARDQVGNPIPSNVAEITQLGGGTQKYMFPHTPEGLQAALQQQRVMAAYGVQFPVPYSVGGWIVACSNVGSQLPRCSYWPL